MKGWLIYEDSCGIYRIPICQITAISFKNNVLIKEGTSAGWYYHDVTINIKDEREWYYHIRICTSNDYMCVKVCEEDEYDHRLMEKIAHAIVDEIVKRIKENPHEDINLNKLVEDVKSRYK